MGPRAGGWSHSARRAARLTAGLFVPHTAVVLARRIGPLRSRGPAPAIEPARDGAMRPFDYEDAVSFLATQGLDEQAVRIGSIPAPSLGLVAAAVAAHLPRRPLRVLHVGNFVGVSLAAVSDIVLRHDPESTVVSVDPNLTPLGVDHPQDRTVALLSHFGLQRSNLVICGYSLERAEPHTATPGFGAAEPAGEETLTSLERLGLRFDLMLIDGNHDSGYLRRELDALVRLSEPGALLVVDDVSHVYKEVRRLFQDVAADDAWPVEEVERNERLGILRVT